MVTLYWVIYTGLQTVVQVCLKPRGINEIKTTHNHSKLLNEVIRKTKNLGIVQCSNAIIEVMGSNFMVRS